MPLFKKNTLEQTQFRLTAAGFFYRGHTYDFSEIVETRSYRATQQIRYPGLDVAISKTHAMSFMLILKDGKDIRVTEQPTMTSSSTENRVDQLQYAFDELCRQTFQQRVQKYVDQIQSTGFFEYSGWKFSPSQQTLTDARSGRAYAVKDLQFLRSYGYVDVKPTRENVVILFMRKLIGTRYSIGTLSDTDAFFALLAHYFQVKWST